MPPGEWLDRRRFLVVVEQRLGPGPGRDKLSILLISYRFTLDTSNEDRSNLEKTTLHRCSQLGVSEDPSIEKRVSKGFDT